MKPVFIARTAHSAQIWIPPSANDIIRISTSKIKRLFFPLIVFPEMIDIDVNTARGCEDGLKMAATFAAKASNRGNPKGGLPGAYMVNDLDHKAICIFQHAVSPQIDVRSDEYGAVTISIPRLSLDVASANQARTVIGQAIQDAEQMRMTRVS